MLRKNGFVDLYNKEEQRRRLGQERHAPAEAVPNRWGLVQKLEQKKLKRRARFPKLSERFHKALDRWDDLRERMAPVDCAVPILFIPPLQRRDGAVLANHLAIKGKGI